MKRDKDIPVYNICALQDKPSLQQDDILVEHFGAYLKRHPNLYIPHRHSFYHLVLFTKGAGSHTIDFEQFKVKVGQIYFMIPGQVHSWQFEGATDGYVINFSAHLFQSFLRKENYLEQFSFFEGIASHAVCNLKPNVVKDLEQLMLQIIKELNDTELLAADKVKMLLLELFIIVARNSDAQNIKSTQSHGDRTLHQFRKLVDQHFATLKLPKDYAALLNITPNHLNALCNSLLGQPAGAIIRDRIILEAKRLLVNGDLSISEIAYQLDFQDNSYFTKFFKKSTGFTPEVFRKNMLLVP